MADAGDFDLPIVSFSGSYDNGKIREIIATMIIFHEYPFRMVEHLWFNVLMKTLNPSYQKMSRTTIKNECMRIFQSRKETLMKKFQLLHFSTLNTFHFEQYFKHFSTLNNIPF